ARQVAPDRPGTGAPRRTHPGCGHRCPRPHLRDVAGDRARGSGHRRRELRLRAAVGPVRPRPRLLPGARRRRTRRRQPLQASHLGQCSRLDPTGSERLMSVTIDKTTSAKTSSPEADSARPRRSLGPMFEKYALVLALIAVVVVFSALRPETYPTANNLQNILGSQAVLLVLALGLIVPLTAGEFDLSAVSTMSLAAMTIAVLNVQHGWSLLPAIAVAVLACLVVGLINAL